MKSIGSWALKSQVEDVDAFERVCSCPGRGPFFLLEAACIIWYL